MMKDVGMEGGGDGHLDPDKVYYPRWGDCGAGIAAAFGLPNLDPEKNLK